MNIIIECSVRRGDIFIAEIDSANPHGSEQIGKRPVVVLQNNIGNARSTTIIVALMTTQPKTDMPTHVKLQDESGLDNRNSTVLLEQIKTLDVTRFIARLGSVSQEDMKRIDTALKISLSLE